MHEPQCAALPVMSTQAPLHSVSPGAQPFWHWPSEHTNPAPQAMPQVPQLSGSDIVSVQVPLQSVVVPLQSVVVLPQPPVAPAPPLVLPPDVLPLAPPVAAPPAPACPPLPTPVPAPLPVAELPVGAGAPESTVHAAASTQHDKTIPAVCRTKLRGMAHPKAATANNSDWNRFQSQAERRTLTCSPRPGKR